MQAKKIIVQPDGAYSLKFPRKGAHPSLPTNCTIYICSQNQIYGQHLSKAPLLLQLYNQIITDQETRGFIERVNHYCEKGLVH